MAKKLPTRADDMGVDLKKLRRLTKARIATMCKCVNALDAAWNELEDSVLPGVFDDAAAAINALEVNLEGIAEYHDQPVGEG